MNYVVLGAGLQGPAVAYGLSVLRPDSKIWLVEVDKARMKRARWLLYNQLDCTNITFVKNQHDAPILDPFASMEEVTVVSTLPYYLNKKVAKQCIDKSWHYFDLGGHIQTSKEITEMAENCSSRVMTDTGLAPGLVNIFAENACKLVNNPKDLLMFCGGLPLNPFANEINYELVFSPDGLVNEYFNDCEALIDGSISKVEPMGDIDQVFIENFTYESFNTSGATHTTLESVKKMGLKNCRYQTLRYPGHAKVFRFLKNTMGLSNESIKTILNDKISRTAQDKVLIAIKVVGDSNYIVDYQVLYDDNFTAMQKCTGFGSAATVASAEDKSGLISYSDVPFDLFFNNLNILLPLNES